eukprot:scaffold648213_cov55-Attheya_sp.AAC.3
MFKRCPNRGRFVNTPPSPVVRDNDNRGDLMIRGFWSRGTDCIVNVRITNLDSKSYLKKESSDNVLAALDKSKKRNVSILLRVLPNDVILRHLLVQQMD